LQVRKARHLTVTARAAQHVKALEAYSYFPRSGAQLDAELSPLTGFRGSHIGRKIANFNVTGDPNKRGDE
jgi:hypothetical protein